MIYTIALITLERGSISRKNVGNTDSKQNAVKVCERTRKSFRCKPNSRLYVNAIVKKIIFDFVIFISNLLNVRNPLKRRSGRTEGNSVRPQTKT